jgi:hypothetical protein
MADNKNKTPQERAREASDPSNVKALQAEELSLANILRLKLQIREAESQTKTLIGEMQKLSKDQAKQIGDYTRNQKDLNTALKQQEKLKGDIADLEARGGSRNRARLREAKEELKLQQQTERSIREELKASEKSVGVSLYKRKQEASIKQKGLAAEKDLIKAINRERGLLGRITDGNIGGNIQDLFRTQGRKQLQIDIARAKAGGGPNIAGKVAGENTNSSSIGGNSAIAAAGPMGAAIAGATAAIEKMKAPIKALGNLIYSNLTKPFSEAASLVSGGVGIGGGAVSGAGATSLLGGLADVASKIPYIGGLLGTLIAGFKGVLDFALGIDSANTRIAKSLGISKKEAIDLKNSFVETKNIGDSIVVNQTRLVESQIELSQQLGVNNTLSRDILATNIELKEVAGLEVEARKSLAQTAIITNRSQKEITKSVLGQVAMFKGLTGIGFNFKDILGEAAKQTGVMGLEFAKYPEKLTKALVSVKALGFNLNQVNEIAGSLVDFESSISKEFEAQVLLGRDINLTKAREAALNNDLATVASEITKNVGDAGSFLKLNRIQQDAIAQSVGMTRDSLADTLKQQEAFNKLGAKDLQQANAKIQALQAQGKTQEQISKMLGEDAYNYITQTSTAEKLAEVMNKIKIVFVQFVEKSGLIEFLTNPQRIESFIKSVVGKLAGAVEVIGDIIGGILDFISVLPGTDKLKYQGLASKVRSGANEFGGGIRSMGNSLNFGGTDSISGTVEAGTKSQKVAGGAAAATQQSKSLFNQNTIVYVGTEKWSSTTRTALQQDSGTTIE